MSYSLLDDPLFRVRGVNDTVTGASLPEVLHTLAQHNVTGFEALQPHQHQPWYSFLVQLAAMATVRTAGPAMPDAVRGWHTALRALSDGTEAWHLVTPDVTQPAFMQPPIPEGHLAEAYYKDDIPTPDQLDVLITSKNHDVKTQRITQPAVEHWIYALITLQTMEGFLGRGNYGIVRMNGGFGNRPLVGLAPDLSWGRRFRRDVQVLLDARHSLLNRYRTDGHALLWTVPWDGAKDSAIPLDQCDPYVIEICRRIRFTQHDDGALTCWRANTKGQRLHTEDDLNGITGDPWTPIDKEDAKALTLGGSGFTYDRLQDIFFGGNYERPPALRFQEDEAESMYLVARALVRGQGKTEGLHYRVVPVPADISKRFLQKKTVRERLAKRAKARVEQAAAVRRRVLYPAIGALFTGRRDERPDSDQLAPWLSAFDQAVDDRFFEVLWASVAMDETEALHAWQALLYEEARVQFDDAQDHAPRSSTRYWRARSTAQSIFYGAARTHLPGAFDDETAATSTT